MKTYMVAKAEEVDGEMTWDVIGVVRAATPLELFQFVDEVGNPNDYEYLRVHAGTPGGFLAGQSVGWFQDADIESKWRPFEDIVGGNFSKWYAEVYAPSLPMPE